jgi:hypothetical protein
VELGMGYMPIIPALRRITREDCEFEVSLEYRERRKKFM